MNMSSSDGMSCAVVFPSEKVAPLAKSVPVNGLIESATRKEDDPPPLPVVDALVDPFAPPVPVEVAVDCELVEQPAEIPAAKRSGRKVRRTRPSYAP
jgi:hypothetical protein